MRDDHWSRRPNCHRVRMVLILIVVQARRYGQKDPECVSKRNKVQEAMKAQTGSQQGPCVHAAKGKVRMVLLLLVMTVGGGVTEYSQEGESQCAP